MKKEVIKKIEISNLLDEDHITEKYMLAYGGNQFENVRGGQYNFTHLDKS